MCPRSKRVLSLQIPLCSLVKENPSDTVLNPAFQAACQRTHAQDSNSLLNGKAVLACRRLKAPPWLGPAVSLMSHLPIQT